MARVGAVAAASAESGRSLQDGNGKFLTFWFSLFGPFLVEVPTV